MASLPGFDLSGKIALVTGGAKGIGAGIAEVLAEAGATVVIADLDLAAAQEQASKLRDRGLAAHDVRLDLSDEQSIVTCVGTVEKRHGTPWILVNNAGLQTREALLEGTSGHWAKIESVNGRGAFLMTREVAKRMVAAGQGGRIVNIASGALRGGVIKGLAAYTASKGALAGLTLQSAFELAEHGITANAVLPGAVITPGAIAAGTDTKVAAEGPASSRPRPFGFAEPRDIGHAVLYFASPAAGKVTNQEICVDSGFSIG